ncbi:MAG: WYL domain-containing protein [Comamonadaceae bacterium]|nr:WYL domain-containing protein [Comamonadaceae bacterium]
MTFAGKRQLELKAFEQVALATISRMQIKITHLSRERAERVERTISPQELVHYRDNWYIDSWCHLRNGIRSFGLDAIEHVEILDTPAQDVDTVELRRVTQGSYGIFAGQPTAWAMLRFTKHRAQWVEGELWHPQQMATPIMVERSARGLYTANLGNLQPGETAVIEIEYAQLLRFEQGQIRITVPTTVAPRFVTPTKPVVWHRMSSVDASLLAEYPFTARITLTGEIALASVHCPSHAIAMVSKDGATVVKLDQGAMLDRDFVLILQGLEGQSFVTVAPDGDQFAVLASFCPKLPKQKSAPLFLKILVDCSGSRGATASVLPAKHFMK